MKPLSRKNIHRVLKDIRHHSDSLIKPAVSADGAKTLLKSKNKIPGGGFVLRDSKLRPLRKASIFISVISVLGVLIFSWYLWDFKNHALVSESAIYDNLKSAGMSSVNLELDAADSSLKIAEQEVLGLEKKVSFFGIFPILKEIPIMISEIKDLISRLRNINGTVEKLQEKGFDVLFTDDKESIVPLLKNLKTEVVTVGSIISDLRNRFSKFSVLPTDESDNYLTLNLKAGRLSEGLESLISLLEKPGQIHFAVLFENPSEMRPGGGFVGSYADLIFLNGSVKSIEVDDIYRPEIFSDSKIVPPRQLQSVTRNWGARDANWFFNFPDSARKITEFLEGSSIYENDGVTFDGVVAVNVRVMEDFLKIAGPVEIPEYKIVLDSENFLKEVQWEVETGRGNKAGQNSKKILKFILPKVLENLGKLDQGRKRLVMDALTYRLNNKDIKFYFKDKKMQNMVSEAHFAGEVYNIPVGWNGDYLALVDANVHGGKTDLFVIQKVELVSKIGTDGTLINNLNIIRRHNGEKEKEDWYRETNYNFVKIFTPFGSKLAALTGNTPKTIKPLVMNYEKKGYSVDYDLAIIENTEEFLKEFDTFIYSESGKTVFGTWFDVPAGKTKELDMSYIGQNKVNLKPGSRFQFVLDKQSGVESQFDYILEAPSGFKWKEVNDFIYRYKSDTMPARLVIDLTLEKI